MCTRFSITLACLTFVVAGCAPKLGTVVPLQRDSYEVVTHGKTKEKALRSALQTAEVTCHERNLRYVVLEHETEYRGVLPEEAVRTVEKAQEIVVATTGQWTPGVSSKDDYRMSMRFRCQA